MNLYTVLMAMYHLTNIKLYHSSPDGFKTYEGTARELINKFGYSKAKSIAVVMIDTHYSRINIHTLEK